MTGDRNICPTCVPSTRVKEEGIFSFVMRRCAACIPVGRCHDPKSLPTMHRPTMSEPPIRQPEGPLNGSRPFTGAITKPPRSVQDGSLQERDPSSFTRGSLVLYQAHEGTVSDQGPSASLPRRASEEETGETERQRERRQRLEGLGNRGFPGQVACLEVGASGEDLEGGWLDRGMGGGAVQLGRAAGATGRVSAACPLRPGPDPDGGSGVVLTLTGS
ncbi:hypothetical protein P4O66_002376 [Electrophorus voltai]|uniref:Uncharacterized protein n=1 Tax=Electrophorus voltai TaxID=2609070 RepID=A0AAD9DQ88_9TELE|nr:hypothetical protein P4O66_002376 [Electrophorus voltai]